MGDKLDLLKLREEIDERKKEKTEVAQGLGEGVSSGPSMMPRDEFLNGLLKSLNTGTQSKSTDVIRLVERTTAEKQGETPASSAPTMSSELVSHSNRTTSPAPSVMTESPERDNLMYEEIERNRCSCCRRNTCKIYR